MTQSHFFRFCTVPVWPRFFNSLRRAAVSSIVVRYEVLCALRTAFSAAASCRAICFVLCFLSG